MELEQLKTSWKELSEKMEKAEIFNRQVTMNMLRRNAKSTAGKLEKYEMIFFVISVLYSGFLGVALALNNSTLIKNESIIVCLVLFILAAIWQGYKLIILQKIRFDSCTTIELLTRVTKYKLLTKGRLIAGMITLIPLFALLIYFQRDGKRALDWNDYRSRTGTGHWYPHLHESLEKYQRTPHRPGRD